MARTSSASCNADVLTVDPREDGPRERESRCRLASAERLRNGERHCLREDGQPFHLALESCDILLLPRKSYELVRAEPVVRVVGSAREDCLDRQIGPLREAAGDEALHEGWVGVDLVRVHPHAQPPP
jgi:hypothetical protein